MLKSTEKKVISARIRLIGLIIIAVLSLAAWLVCQFAIGGDKLGFAPIWIFFIVGFGLTAVLYIFVSIATKKAINFVIGGASLFIAMLILMICLDVLWYVILMVSLVLLFATFIIPFVMKAPQLAVEFDNAEDSGRKTYVEKKAEEEAQNKLKEEALKIAREEVAKEQAEKEKEKSTTNIESTND